MCRAASCLPVYRKELQKMKKVYTCFTTDVIHEAHINIIKEAAKYGEVYVGVMTDRAMVSFDRFPTIPLEGRIRKIKAIPGVSHVIVQDSVMYDQIIRELRPDYVIHGDNWLSGPTKLIRDNAKSALDSYGGKIIDIPYTYNENIKKIEKKLKREQRKLSRKYESLEIRNKNIKEGRATRQNIQKQIVKVQKLHQRLTNIRTDYINKIVSSIIKQKPSYITIEDLNVKGMMKNKHLSKAVAQQKFNEFRNKLATKCNALGIELRIVDRFYPSSKLCHKCGSIKKDLKLKDRIFNCDCGYVEDRDYNASLNLRDAKIYKTA